MIVVELSSIEHIKMLSTSLLVLFTNFVSISAIPMITYNNAYFNPTDDQSQLTTLSSMFSRDACACCYSNNSQCVTGSFFSINQTCILFSAHIWLGQLQLIGNRSASVFSFPNRTTITCKSTKIYSSFSFTLIRSEKSTSYN